MRLAAIHFHNYRLFADATLPLGVFTLVVGANGTGKSTALNALNVLRNQGRANDGTRPLWLSDKGTERSSVTAVWDDGKEDKFEFPPPTRPSGQDPSHETRLAHLKKARVFSFIPERIAAPVSLTKTLELQSDGSGLPAVLTTLQDQYPERFDGLNADLRRWMPEFDRLLFDTPTQGTRSILLRTQLGGHAVGASDLSHGTLLALALLTLCHLPKPPTILGIEEPDRGIHPRLLREVADALLRLTAPESFGDSRAPIQVIATTHSPYMVDLFRDDLEDVVIATKDRLRATFVRVADLPNVDEILRDAPLGEAWYSGILGGVPQTT